MKNSFLFLLTIIITFFVAELAFGEEYEVVKGDDLSTVLLKTESTKEQLHALNPRADLNNLQPKQGLYFISKTDQKIAVQYCWDQTAKYSKNDGRYKFFKKIAMLLEDWQISYGPGGDKVPCQLVLFLVNQSLSSDKQP